MLAVGGITAGARASPKIEAIILDADTVPIMTLEQARARPTAAVLVAALHGSRGNLEAARIAIAAIEDLPDRQRDGYIATILAALPVRQRVELLEELPMKEPEDELWYIEKRSGTYHVGREAGREEGRKAGRREEARKRLIELILAILEVRNIEVDESSESRIRAQTRLQTLERWATRSRRVAQVGELFEPA